MKKAQENINKIWEFVINTDKGNFFTSPEITKIKINEDPKIIEKILYLISFQLNGAGYDGRSSILKMIKEIETIDWNFKPEGEEKSLIEAFLENNKIYNQIVKDIITPNISDEILGKHFSESEIAILREKDFNFTKLTQEQLAKSLYFASELGSLNSFVKILHFLPHGFLNDNGGKILVKIISNEYYNPEIVKTIIKKNPNLIESRESLKEYCNLNDVFNFKGQVDNSFLSEKIPLLAIASYFGKEDVVGFLLKEYLGFYDKNQEHIAESIITAIASVNINLAIMLIMEFKGDYNLLNIPLHAAAKGQQSIIVNYLLERGAQLTIQNGDSPLRSLLKDKPNLNKIESWSYCDKNPDMKKTHNENYIKMAEKLLNPKIDDKDTFMIILDPKFNLVRDSLLKVFLESLKVYNITLTFDDRDALLLFKEFKHSELRELLKTKHDNISINLTKAFVIDMIEEYRKSNNKLSIDILEEKLKTSIESVSSETDDLLLKKLNNCDIKESQELLKICKSFNPYEGKFSIFEAAKRGNNNLVKSILSLKSEEGISLVNVNHKFTGETLYEIYEKLNNIDMMNFLKKKGASFDFDLLPNIPKIENFGGQNVHDPKVKAAVSYSIKKGRELFARKLEDKNINERFEYIKKLAIGDKKVVEVLNKLQTGYKEQEYDNVGEYKYIGRVKISAKEAIVLASYFIEDLIENPKSRMSEFKLSETDNLDILIDSMLFPNLREAATGGAGGGLVCQQGAYNRIFDMPIGHVHCFKIPHLIREEKTRDIEVKINNFNSDKSVTINLINDFMGSLYDPAELYFAKSLLAPDYHPEINLGGEDALLH